MATAMLQLDPETDWMYRAKAREGWTRATRREDFRPSRQDARGIVGHELHGLCPWPSGRFRQVGDAGGNRLVLRKGAALLQEKRTLQTPPTPLPSIPRPMAPREGWEYRCAPRCFRPPCSSSKLQKPSAFLAATTTAGIDPIPPGVASLFQTTTEKGRRSSTYHAFIEGEPEARGNLTIITRAHVTKVLLDDADGGLQATGIEYEDEAGKRHRHWRSNGKSSSAAAPSGPRISSCFRASVRSAELEFADITCRLDSTACGQAPQGSPDGGDGPSMPGASAYPLAHAALSLGPDALRGPGGPLPANPAEDDAAARET